jgi:tetratricopeptide (TPR) repeat protein
LCDAEILGASPPLPVIFMRIEELIEQALALAPSQRESYAVRACGTDKALYDRLMRLLASAEAEDGFLDRPALRLDPPASEVSAAVSGAGRCIGAFKLIRRLGAGGMGEVWLAERTQGEFKQTVALKIMLPGAGAALERFKIERRILASLEHPGIARLHDGGVTDEGWPWMAMEYVEGQELLTWCNERSANLKQRLELFLQVCDAVTYAHSHLVVHRDLKPANIFITREGEVKLLDFGLAKLLTLDTAVVGANTAYFSPAYAAPEQLETGAVTTATDVFALGVTLFELLCGRLPWPAQRAPLGAAFKRLLGDAPPAPSRVAQSLVPAGLLRGDLDAIVAKALRHDPSGRYADARGLAEDLRRHLRHEPVEARAGARAYVARRFLRRHWFPLAAAAALFIVLLAGLTGVAWQARRAASEAVHAAATRDFLLAMFKASDPRIAQDKPRGQITARELLDASIGKIDREFAGDPPTQIDLLGVATEIYRELGEEQRYDDLHHRHLAAARRYYGEKHPIVLAALLSDAVRAKDKLDFADALLQLDALDPKIHEADLDRTPLRARWWLIRGQALLDDSSKIQEQFAALRKAADLLADVAPVDPMRVTVLADLGTVYAHQMDYAPAREFMEKAVAISTEVKNRDDAELAVIFGNLGQISLYLGKFDEADHAYEHATQIIQRTYGDSSSQTWFVAAQRARAAHLGGNRAKALVLFAALLKVLPDTADIEAIEAREWYAGCLAAEGRPSEAVPLLEAAERTYQGAHQFDFQLPRLRATLGDAYARVGRVDDARRTFKAAFDWFIASDPPDFQPVLAIRERWGRFLLSQGELAGAAAQFQEVVQQAHGRAFVHVALAYGGIARVALAQGDYSAALSASAEAVGRFDAASGFRDVRMGPYLWLIHSEILRKNADPRGAREWAQRALEASRRYDHPSAASIAEAAAAVRLTDGGRTS